ncbi:MAG: hypothetical protein ACP5M0_11660 [Desulfomonilaceae bacterium]
MKTDYNRWSFLTGRDPFISLVVQHQRDDEYAADLCFEYHHEGAIGLPHGGLAMGLCLDIWRNYGSPEYPARVSFRFGGSGLKIGEHAQLHATVTQDHRGPVFSASITKYGDKKPYLRAEVVSLDAGNVTAPAIEKPGDVTRLLPYYRNCFVCGRHREVVGLQRRFRYHETPDWQGVSVLWGDGGEDRDRARCFLIGERELHPAVITSIFDENTGWAGFMRTKGAGLTVRMDLTLLRPVECDDQLLFIGQPEGVRGNASNPRFFTANGIALSMNSPGGPATVAMGSGEWIILQSITEQVKRHLLPDDDWQWIFEE